MKLSIALSSVFVAVVFANPASDQPQAQGLHKRGKFARGQKAAYLKQCDLIAASQNIDPISASAYCKCGADAIEDSLKTEEIATLTSGDQIDAKIAEKAKRAVLRDCKLV